MDLLDDYDVPVRTITLVIWFWSPSPRHAPLAGLYTTSRFLFSSICRRPRQSWSKRRLSKRKLCWCSGRGNYGMTTQQERKCSNKIVVILCLPHVMSCILLGLAPGLSSRLAPVCADFGRVIMVIDRPVAWVELLHVEIVSRHESRLLSLKFRLYSYLCSRHDSRLLSLKFML